MLTKKGKYALIAILHLARKYGDAPTRIAELAQEEGIPQKFLEAILLELKNNGFLISKKGKGGGYTLRASPDYITVGEVIRAIEGPIAPVPCVSRTTNAKCPECKEGSVCGIRIVMQEVRDAISEVLDNATLTDVLNRVNRAGSS